MKRDDSYNGKDNITLLYPPQEQGLLQESITGPLLEQYTENLFTEGGAPSFQYLSIYDIEDIDLVHIRLLVFQKLLIVDPVLNQLTDRYCWAYGTHLERYKRPFPCSLEIPQLEHRIIRRLAWREDQIISRNRDLRQSLHIRDEYIGDYLDDYLLLLQDAIKIELVEQPFDHTDNT